MKVMVNFLAFQIGWFACVLDAANGMPWLGPLVCAPILTLHFAMADQPGAEFRLVLLAVGGGLVLDSLLVQSGWLSYANGLILPGLAPYWILVMWALFASTLNVSMRWMHGKLGLSAIFGAIGGPLSYLAGERLGAVVFENGWYALTALGVGWALAMPLLMLAASNLDRATATRSAHLLERVDA